MNPLHSDPAIAANAARTEQLARWSIWIIPALWAVNYIVARRAPGVIEPYALACGRWGIVCLVLCLLARSELWHQRRAIARVWPQYVALGFFGMVVCGAWVYIGAKTTGAMNIALIYSASPVLIALGAVWWLKETMRWTQAAGVLLALAGVVHVVVKGQWTALSSVQWVAGDAWIVMAMVSWALYALLQKRWPSELSPTARLAAICLGSMVILVPGATWELMQPGTPAWSWTATLLVLAAALGPGLGAYWIYGWAQRVIGASRVAVTLYLSPLYAALAAWGVLDEPLGWHHLAGAMLIFPGVYLVSRIPK